MAAAADGLVLQEGEAVGNGDELSISEVRGSERGKGQPNELICMSRLDLSISRSITNL